jgi:HlyD family secretion protein
MATKQSSGKSKWIVVFIAIVAVAAGGLWYFRRGSNDAPDYQTEPVGRGELTQVVTATGTLNPVMNVTVGSQVSGRITRLFVDYNSMVKSNEVIAQIDPSTYEAQLNQSKANLANVKANLALQTANLKRAAELFTNNLIASSDYDTARAQWEQASAQVKIQEAAVTNALANLSYCKILSPVDGVVISRSVELGQTVASSFSTPTLFQIANDLTKMQIDASVDEADIGGVKEHQPVDFTVDAYPNRTFHGIVTQVRNAPTTVNNVVTYDCVIGVTNADYSLKPGMTASVSIIVAERNNVLEIPNAALRFQPPDTAVIENAAATAAGATNTSVSRGGPRGPGGFRGGSGGFRGGGGGFRGGPGGFRGGPGGFRGERGGPGGMGGQQSPIHTVYLLVTNSPDSIPQLKAVQVRTGITDNINTEVLSGLNEGDQVVTGLAIPGLTSSEQTRNPFAGGRRF